MNAIKSILLHVDATARCRVRLALAELLAAQHEAAVTAMYAATPAAMQVVSAGGDAAPFMLKAAADLDAQRLRDAREIFDSGRPGARVQWAQLEDGAVIPTFARSALLHDLLVLGQYDRVNPATQGVPADFAEAVITESGKPTLVIPYVGDFRSIGRNMLVAWKPTRESARALSAALPLLQRADQVNVVSWGDDPEQIGTYLQRHGIVARFHREGAAGGEVGELLLSRASDFGSDLIVMGCYGHTRMRELVLGGASRTVFDSMTVPVFAVH